VLIATAEGGQRSLKLLFQAGQQLQNCVDRDRQGWTAITHSCAADRQGWTASWAGQLSIMSGKMARQGARKLKSAVRKGAAARAFMIDGRPTLQTRTARHGPRTPNLQTPTSNLEPRNPNLEPPTSKPEPPNPNLQMRSRPGPHRGRV